MHNLLLSADQRERNQYTLLIVHPPPVAGERADIRNADRWCVYVM